MWAMLFCPLFIVYSGWERCFPALLGYKFHQLTLLKENKNDNYNNTRFSTGNRRSRVWLGEKALGAATDTWHHDDIIFGMIGFMQPVAYTVATTVLFGALLLAIAAQAAHE